MKWNFNNTYVHLPESFYSIVEPKPVRSPKLVRLNENLAEALGLDKSELKGQAAVEVFAGNQIPKGGVPLAQAYAGHQFGYFTMLGDGRAMLLGEHITPDGERLDIQLKGSGRTPYSRGGDGRAALGPMLREYIISEAMHALGIPTTRSLAVVTTGESIVRETMLPGAILTRVAASHLRVGTFQYAASRGNIEELRSLADYAIARHYPEFKENAERYVQLLQAVIQRQASLIAKWQLVGFIHGVMNTDNMTISGETIDYGPCAFMDTYDPNTVFSSIDTQGRYAFGNQPNIAAWNLARFAESLLPLLHEDPEEAVRLAEQQLEGYGEIYHHQYMAGMRSKLGIFNTEDEDESLMGKLLGMMKKYKADYTNTFRLLTLNQLSDSDLFDSSEFAAWDKRWKDRLGRQAESEEDSRALMQRSNPAVIARNHRVEEALEGATIQGDFSKLDKLLTVLSNPFAYSEEQEEFCSLPVPGNRPYRTYCGT
ncbi:YdiU family protein [Paenibacillus sp. CAA11]|uniref:protein adenylyltransferase SelO n=1 Tax=Paenibacillus sp. CAA11 TaxID=1532905 RepID=UPI000D396A32|nr:YdiU family protein [Paenibacillus sp. CAA11]AWB44593.1 YdiU family protein [Paenibacillus sp. CAA11]